MAFLEKSNWVVLVVASPTLLVYGVLVVPQLLERPVAEVSWVQPMLVAVAGFVVANVLGNVLAAVSRPSEADLHDERDRDINRFGERLGTWPVVLGGCAALLLAMLRVDHFWIANALLAGAMVGAVVSSVAKIAAYRRSVPGW